MDKVKSIFEKEKEYPVKEKSLAEPETPKVKKKKKSIFDIFRRKKKGE